MTKPIKLAMMIDDAEFDQRQYKRILEESNLVEEIVTFIYADEAIEYLAQNPHLEVSVIFLDINMPRMNGFEFLEAALERFGEDFVRVVVVMLTTSLNPEDERRANSFSVVKDFISKPLSIEHVQKVAGLLED